MNRFLSSVVVVVGMAGTAAAQLPLPVPVPAPGGSNTLQRLPDDQIEGTIFEYQGTLDAASKSQGNDKDLEGKFRLERSAIFDLSPTLKIPGKDAPGNPLEKIASGQGGNVKLPQPPQQKRLGQFKKTGAGRLRLEFDDKESLVGTMLINREKGTEDVWIGTFTERKDGRAGRVWKVKVRPIED